MISDDRRLLQVPSGPPEAANRRLPAWPAARSARGASAGANPDCGSAGVVPAVLYHLKKEHRFSGGDILKGLAAAGLIGNLAKVLTVRTF